MKKDILKYTLLGIIIITVSACAKRQNLDEYGVVKYKPLVISTTDVLERPDVNAKPLGYESSRDIVHNLQNTLMEVSVDVMILEKFKIKKIDDRIKLELSQSQGDAIVVNIKKESERIAYNLKNGKKITDGKTPSVNIKSTKSGMDQIFD